MVRARDSVMLRSTPFSKRGSPYKVRCSSPVSENMRLGRVGPGCELKKRSQTAYSLARNS